MLTDTTLRWIYRRLPLKPAFARRMYFNLRRLWERNRVVTRTIDGITYELHLNEFIDSEIYRYGCFEAETTRAIGSILHPGMTVVDIGANIGAHALRMSQLVGDSGQVIAFEPMEWALTKLKKNIELNGYKNIVVEKIALSDKSEVGAAAFRTSWNKYDSLSSGTYGEREIIFDTFDRYIATRNIKSVDFIKLDVDGFEHKVLTGASAVLSNFKPIISMELGNWTLEKQGDSLKGMIQLLRSLDYLIFRESDFMELSDFEAIIKEFPDPEKWTINVIAAPSARKYLLNDIVQQKDRY